MSERIKINKKRNKEIINTEGNFIINNRIVISEGKIMNNPFSKRLENSEASQWIIKNEDKVKGSIQKRFRMMGIYWGDIEECYDLLLNEFNTRPELQFNKNHFGKGTGYAIEEYILNKVKFVVRKYRNELNKYNAVPLITQDESDYYYGEIEENFAENNSTDIGEEIVNKDLSYWDDKFEFMSTLFEEFLEERSYREFDFNKFLYYMFLDVKEVEKDRLEKNYDRVSYKLGESRELVETVVDDMILAVKERDDLGESILSMIKELLEGKSNGWTPYFIRKEK